MTLEDIADFLNLAASLAVIATLGFVALQIRHNTQITRLAAAQASTEMLTVNLGRVVEHADLAELVVRRTDEGLTPAERLRVTNFLSASFRHYEVVHAHRRIGLYEEELWQSCEARIRDNMDQPAIRTWWRENDIYYAASFRRYIDRLVEETDAASAA